MLKPLLALPLLLCLAAPAAAQSVKDTYDATWYRSTGWSGEYPNGFTVLKDTTVKLRPTLSPSAEKTIDCPLSAKSTFHPWNSQRFVDQGLDFVAFTKIGDWEVTAPYDLVAYSEAQAAEQTISLKPGDKWRYLDYYAEGTFLMELNGEEYTADQSLIDASKEISKAEGYDEWLRINCSNNMWGWLFVPDLVIDDTTFAGPNITEYGAASDLP